MVGEHHHFIHERLFRVAQIVRGTRGVLRQATLTFREGSLLCNY
jgi:hypothetical protein